ncbi:MAG: gliding motility-associated C-terminal domain-containing protein [Bacteroidetes bacterium]|nr:gliding motility-associated C-terminal domain-containing protein [Bacteroidota bacterium]
MNKKLKYLIFVFFLMATIQVRSQCWISLMVDSLSPDTVEICRGDSVKIALAGECLIVYNDFNSGALGDDWEYVTPGTVSSPPCDPNEDHVCLWFGEETAVPRIIETKWLDLTPGGYLSFDLLFGVQGDPPGCEGPDEMLEGVSLQYSVDNGITWIDMTYFCPNGTFLPTNPNVQSPLTYDPTPFTTWGNYHFQIPPEAQTPYTRLRWIQTSCSFFNDHFDDNWGLDNIKVSRSFSQSVQWSTGSANMGPVTVAPTQTTTYYVYIIGSTIPPSVIASDSMVVYVHSKPIPEFIGKQEICKGQNTVIQAIGPYSYNWSTGSTTDIIYAQPDQTTTYTVTATDNIGCTGIDSVTVLVHPLPLPDITGDSVCKGEMALVIIHGGVTYQWDNGMTGSQLMVQPEETTSYWVTVTDEYGCQNTGSGLVIVNPLPMVSLNPDPTICHGESISLTAGGGEQYYWSNGDRHKTAVVSPEINTTYTVTVIDQYGCQNSGSVTVLVAPEVIAGIVSSSDTVCSGAEAVLTATGGSIFEWSNGSSTPAINVQPSFTSTYSVTVSETFENVQCSGIQEYTVIVTECSTVFIPNAFTPKGYNPNFKPIGDFMGINNYVFQIFDRWGKLLFETTNPEEGWDGTSHGQYMQGGVYAYRLSYSKAIDGAKVEKIGTLTIVE